MKKKKNTINPQILSPENYIRQRAKSLPIYKCFINESWEEEKLGYIIIIRKHKTGNVTFCSYLVDLKCLGVKDTQYEFNVPYSVLESVMKKAESFTSFIEISYELAHNIIFSGVEYAEKYGLYPHKDFTATTFYFLEEDNDDIPLIEIECGGEDIDEEEADSIANELLDEILSLSIEEQKKLFIELYKKDRQEENMSNEEAQRFIALTNYLIYSISDTNAVSEQLEVWEQKFDVEFVDEDELPNSLFMNVQSKDGEKLADLFFDTYFEISESKNYKQSMTKLSEEAGDAPVITFLELYVLSFKNNLKYQKKVQEAYQKYPDYLMIQLYYLLAKGKLINATFFENFLTKQKLPITFYEAEFFFTVFALLFMGEKNVSVEKVLALELFYSTLDFLSEDVLSRHLGIFQNYKCEQIIERFGIN